MEKEKNKLILGIDDAGRGPVIGSMVLSGVLVNKEIEQEFKELGVADSKMILRKKREKLNKIQQKLFKRTKDVRNDVSKIEKIKVDALKKTEDIRRSIDKEINKIEGKIAKSKDLAPESKQRLSSEIAMVRNGIENEIVELRGRIAESVIPVVA